MPLLSEPPAALVAFCGARKEWVDDLVRLATSDEHWSAPKTSKGLSIQLMKTPGEKFHMLKATGTVTASVKSVAAFFKDFDNTFALSDTMAREPTMVAVVDDECTAVWSSFKMPFPLSNREFLWASADTMVSPTAGVSVAKSIDLDAVPPRKGLERGKLMTSGYYFEAVSDKETKADPGGMIPSWVVNLAVGDQAANVSRVAAYFAKHKMYPPAPDMAF